MGGSKARETELATVDQTEDVERATAVIKGEVPAYEPEEAPSTLGIQEKNTWIRQDSFLRAFALCRTKTTASKAAGINRNTVMYWERHDTLGFKERLLRADEAFLDSLENLALNRVRAQKPSDNPTLLIMLLNGNLPSKYRSNSVIPSETMTDTLRAMKQSTREFKQLADGSETVTETETVVIKKGLQ